MNVLNPMFHIDGYKLDHRRQYPKGITRVYSNWTPRSSRVEGQKDVTFFGLQYFLKRYFGELMQEHFFNRTQGEVVYEYQEFLNSYLGPNNVGTDHIRDLHKLGYIPLRIDALPEGTKCPLRVPMLVIENTHDDFAWLPNYFETILSNVLWMPCTSATTASRIRKLLDEACVLTTGSLSSFVSWQSHDFSKRGMAGLEAAALSGAAHLLYFTGTDTVPAIGLINRYYPSKTGALIGGSVPATEHSCMSAGGHLSELDTFARLLDIYPTGIVSVVSDTWDLWNVITNILPQLHTKITSREGKLVIRPDSGDPVKIICGDPNATGPAKKGVVELLWEVFGGKVNSMGFKELDSHIGVIYGDAITYDRAKAIIAGLAAKDFASTNIVFGTGSFSYQYVTRDTYGFAMKATWAMINGNGVNLFKDPVTDDGVKRSATGRLAVQKNADGTLKVLEKVTDPNTPSLLQTVWENGTFVKTWSIDDIRAVAMS